MDAPETRKPVELGIYYFPDDLHYRQTDLELWLPELQALGMRWVTLRASLARAVPESFIRGLIGAGLQPIIHLPESPVRPITDKALPILRAYASWGVRYVSLFAPPNQQQAWTADRWAAGSPVEQFLDVYVPLALFEREVGLEPVFPALFAGGDYWDLAFLDAALQSLARRGHSDLLHSLTFAVDAWSHNRPIDWGLGGSASWPLAKPYLTPPNSQDHCGFRGLDWIQEVILRQVGEPRPLLMVRGGARMGDDLDAHFARLDALRHLELNSELARQARAGALPAWVLNLNFWLLACEDKSTFTDEAWYRADGTVLPVVAALKHLAHPGAPLPSDSKSRKVIAHYLLIPAGEAISDQAAWRQLQDYVQTFRPTCGYSVEEALRAERVTLFNDGAVPLLMQRLRNAGCTVDHLSPAFSERSQV